MFAWLKTHISNKFLAILVASVFVAITFACFTVTTNEAHSGDMGTVCEVVMNLTDNTILQTGFVLLITIAAAWLSFASGIFPTQSELNFRLIKLYRPPLHKQTFPRGCSYLCQLFSSGTIHPKLHSFAI